MSRYSSPSPAWLTLQANLAQTYLDRMTEAQQAAAVKTYSYGIALFGSIRSGDLASVTRGELDELYRTVNGLRVMFPSPTK
jgi:hypothetical protein